MSFFADKARENKTGIIFASIAAVLSLFTGLFSGTGFGKILFNIFLFGILFYALGFCVIIIMNKFMPEFFEEEIGKHVNTQVAGEDNESANTREEVVYEDDAGSLNESLEEQGERITEDIKVSRTKDNRISIKTQDGEVTEDPETVAKAIRTMMSRDED